MHWAVAATLSAVCWGLHYAIVERLLVKYSPFTIFLSIIVCTVLFLPFIWKHASQDFQALLSSPWQDKAMLAALVITFVVAAFSILYAIESKDAVYASLIEITYPLFVLVFAAILFEYRDMDLRMMIGGSLILMGTMLLVYEESPVKVGT